MAPLGDAYFRLFAATADMPQAFASPGAPVAVYCHPSQSGDASTLEDINWRLAQYTVQGAPTTQLPGAGDALPGWRLATQRAMERTVAELLDTRQSTYLDPARAGVSRALEFITKAVHSDPDASQRFVVKGQHQGDE